jgi:hypothetical protein
VAEDRSKSETFFIKNESIDKVIEKTKELVREGNIRQIVIRTSDGTTIASFPLTAGVIGAALLPIYAAIAAIAALVTDCSITVEKREPKT